ncbi:phosphate--AMP phosphotransferase [Aquirhabdus parva]|uniref:Phosphate--AMP phosphotransferase n=1 Tax=Aquirhabdus parva TaxID=2283318 RepID=A0A345P8W2_9GAMM|nr:phosphate--AMP phosphotransferase [Aquirhabdus parva]AXI03721.1 phosphate--AMP phosphotransferase [Aquirhabdus parva]
MGKSTVESTAQKTLDTSLDQAVVQEDVVTEPLDVAHEVASIQAVPHVGQHTPDSLRLALIEAQYALRDTRDKPRGRGVVILMSGIELAGKGEALTQLRAWADPRLFKVHARMPVTPHSPVWIKDAALLPEKGEAVILFGNWYGDLLKAHMAYKQEKKSDKKKKDKDSKDSDDSQKMTGARFQRELEHLHAFEQDLRAQGITVCKCWFDLSWDGLQKRLDEVDKSEERWLNLHGLDWRDKEQYDQLQVLRTELGSDWINIDCSDASERNLKFGHIVLDALKTPRLPSPTAARRWQLAEIPAPLLLPDSSVMEKETYKARLKDAQKKFASLIRGRGDRPIVLVFEGMDAAGKGGAITRVVESLDPREYQVFPIAAPEPHELRHPYLWRFWSRLPEKFNGHVGMTIFDRSWYGRVLVERIEGLVKAGEWQSAYAEINRFERDLTSGGVIVLKFWLAISNDEQARRFTSRQQTPHKRFKITMDDWRNRKRWDDYLQSAADMFEHTNTAEAPWVIIASDDKLTARLAVLESLNRRLESVL